MSNLTDRLELCLAACRSNVFCLDWMLCRRSRRRCDRQKNLTGRQEKAIIAGKGERTRERTESSMTRKGGSGRKKTGRAGRRGNTHMICRDGWSRGERQAGTVKVYAQKRLQVLSE